MPKIVNPDERRGVVFDALFDVIAERGVHAASLRAVAERAELAIGSIRHYFDSHDEMLSAAADEMVDRVTARLQAHRDAPTRGANRAEAVVTMLAELLPTTARIEREVAVWLEFIVAARTRPSLQSGARRMRSGTDELCRRLLVGWGVAVDDLDMKVIGLAALIDGLAVQSCLNPDPGFRRDALAVLRQYVTELVPVR